MGMREKQCRREGNKTYIGRRGGRGCKQQVASAQEWVRSLAWAIGWCSHAALAVNPVVPARRCRTSTGGRRKPSRVRWQASGLGSPPRPPCTAGRPAGIIQMQLAG